MEQTQYVRVYTDESGVSHFEDVSPPMQPTTRTTGVSTSDWFSEPLGEPFRLSRVNPASTDPGSAGSGEWGPWHPQPRRGFLVRLAGETETQVSDGEVRRFGPGDLVLFEDTTGQGHRNRRLTPDSLTILIPVAETNPA